MKLRLLWALDVTHGFWEPGPIPGLTLLPEPRFTKWLRSHRLQFRERPGAIEVWGEIDVKGYFRFQSKVPVELCTFSLSTSDNRIWNGTEWPENLGGKHIPTFGHAAKRFQLKLEKEPAAPAARTFPGEFARVKLQLPANLWKRKQAPRFQLRLEAARGHWTYVLITRTGHPEFAIGDNGVRFGSCTPLASDLYPAFSSALQEQFPESSGYFLYQIRSQEKLPLRSRPPNGLSLSSFQGLIKAHLPAPGPLDHFIRVINLVPHTLPSFQ